MTKLSISMEGIEQALDGLNYRKNSVKQKFILAVKAYYSSEADIVSLSSIDTDALIKAIWDIDDDARKIRSKRRNFSSIRSAVNADLKKLARDGKNPENIEITQANIFDMTEDAKNSLLSSVSSAFKTGDDMDINQVTSVLTAVTEFLSEIEMDKTGETPKDLLEQIRRILGRLGNDIFSDEAAGGSGEDPGEKIELAADEELVEIDLDENEELVEVDEDEAEDALEEDGSKPAEIEEELPGKPEETDEFEDPGEDEEFEEVDVLEEDEELEEIDDTEEADPETSEETAEETADAKDPETAEELEDDEEIVEVDEVDEDEAEDVLEEDGSKPAEIEEELPGKPEETDEFEDPGEDEEFEEVDVLEEDEELEEIDDTEEADPETDEEVSEETAADDVSGDLWAAEDLKSRQELARHFDNFLGEIEKKYNIYVKVPAGKYTVGTRKGLKSSLDLQQIDMPDIYMAKYPVTNSLFEVFVEETGYVTTAEKKGYGTVFSGKIRRPDSTSKIFRKDAGSAEVDGAFWFQPEGPGSSLHGRRHHPVVQVSFDDVCSFAAWIGRRLPTEAEWEAAARTDTALKYPWGNFWDENACNAGKKGFGTTTNVDRYDNRANEFNISDMLGNAMEWTADKETAPVGNRTQQQYHIAKGGGWNADATLTISSRSLLKPGFTANTVGFRCMSEIFL